MYSRIDTFNVDGEDVLARELELIRRRVFVDRLNLLSEYPLSLNRRFEMGLGYTRISYDAESERELISPSGQVLLHEETDVDAPDGLNLFHGNAAYVGDYSFFGFTSPVRGKRYRLEAEQTVGSLKYLTLLADYRHYFFWNPVTLAFRTMHYGRYLGDAESDKLSALTLGYETWVRGYSLDSFEMSECTETSDPNRCPEYDRLIGSKVGVMNLEFRVPLLGNEQFGLIDLDVLPTQLSAFLDGGIAWTNDESPTVELTEKSTERIPVFSTGLAARFNLLGYLVGQVYYAYPFQRPEKGAHFGFLLAPGW
jgi:outer membrane protein assembly factor BamA